jgi:hypothetical protein
MMSGMRPAMTVSADRVARQPPCCGALRLATTALVGLTAVTVICVPAWAADERAGTLTAVAAPLLDAGAATYAWTVAPSSMGQITTDGSASAPGAEAGGAVVRKLDIAPALNVPAGSSWPFCDSGAIDLVGRSASSASSAQADASSHGGDDSPQVAVRLATVRLSDLARPPNDDPCTFELLHFPWALERADPLTYSGRSDAPTSLVIAASASQPDTAAAARPGLQAQAAPAGSTPMKPVSKWGTGDGKSYWVPAYEGFGFEVLLNQYDRHFIDESIYGTHWSTFIENLHTKWVIDTDPFEVNQFGHPYQGAMFSGFARSAGLDFWTSMGYAFAGSLVWKEAGETDAPSINDQVTTTLAGPILGEPLFRMASLLLEGGEPGFWRELGAAAISPTLGFSRLAFGDRFRSVFPSNEPSFYTRLQVGGTLGSTVTSNVNVNPDELGTPVSQAFEKNVAILDFSMAYGLPGKPGYTYDRPFDYFQFEFKASSANIFEDIISRGLLEGTSYRVGDDYRGVWGLYGSYDYIDPQIFRVSSTAASIGTTGEWWLSRSVALQGTTLGGVGFGAAGTIHGSGQRDYHYGLTPQALLALRLILGDRVTFDVTGREFYVSGVASTENRGSENIVRADASLTFRIYERHALAFGYVTTDRNAHYPDLPATHQSVGTFGIYYTLLGDTKFGLRDWRSPDAGETKSSPP